MTVFRFDPKALLILAAAVLLPAGAVSASGSPPDDPHAHFRHPGQCPGCHLPSRSKSGPGPVRTDTVDFCLECHLPEGLGVTHPLKIRPGDRYRGITVPPDFLLSVDGKIVCLTCHTAHGPAGNRYLRRTGPDPSGRLALCSGCHRTP